MLRRNLLLRVVPVTENHYDVVVVGSGVAGCLIAGRLGLENIRTLVLEQGADISKLPRWQRELPCSKLVHRYAQRGYEKANAMTIPQRTHRDDEQTPVWIPSPCVLGGGNVMGGRSWNLGDEADWATSRWDFREELLPRVQRMENLEVFQPHRGKRGKFLLSRPTGISPFFKAFSEAMSRDTPLTSNYNKREFRVGPACGRSEVFVDPNTGLAHTSLKHYLLDTIALKRPIRVHCGASVIGVSTDGGDGSLASGVSFKTEGGKIESVRANVVVVAAGGLGSPLLLTASRGSLKVPESVGTNFFDAPSVVLQFRSKERMSHNCFMDKAVQALSYLNIRYGTLIPELRCGYDDMICMWSSTRSATPDVKFTFQPFTMNNDGSTPADVEHGFQVVVQLVRPKSRGTISADGNIDPKYLTVEEDLAALRAGVEHIKKIAKLHPFLGITDGVVVNERFESAGVYGGGCSSAISPDTFLLNGLQNVYVCDESVIPSPLIGDTLPYVLALADKFADRFLNRKDVRNKVTAGMQEEGSTRIVY